MKKTIAILALLVASSNAAIAGDATCTVEELQEKATAAGTAMQALAATNPQLMAEIATDVQAAQSEMASVTDGDYSVLCGLYDTILEKME